MEFYPESHGDENDSSSRLLVKVDTTEETAEWIPKKEVFSKEDLEQLSDSEQDEICRIGMVFASYAYKSFLKSRGKNKPETVLE